MNSKVTAEDMGRVAIRSKARRVKLHFVEPDMQTVCGRYNVTDPGTDVLPQDADVSGYSTCGVCDSTVGARDYQAIAASDADDIPAPCEI